MITKIAVPLDGSLMAENALPYAVRLASHFGGSILLLKSEVSPVPALNPELNETAGAYLEAVKITLADPQTYPHLSADKIEILPVYDEPLARLAEIASSHGADLLVMSTHGYTGLEQLVMGSIAFTIIQHSPLPVLLIHPTLAETTGKVRPAVEVPFSWNFGPVVLALDGTHPAEAALEPAVELAGQLDASLHLVHIISPAVRVQNDEFGMDLDFDRSELDQEMARKKAESDQYLAGIKARMAEKGLICLSVTAEGEPAREVVRYALKVKACAVVLATHARGRMGQFLLGSVAEEVVKLSHLPVLLVNIGRYGKQPETLTIAGGPAARK